MMLNLAKSNYKNTKELNKNVPKFYLKKIKLVVLVRDNFKSLVLIFHKAQLLENNTPFLVVE